MKKKVMAAVLVAAALGLFASFATTASATPSKTSRCSGCHSGSGVTVTATLTSTSGTNATYNVSAPGADYIAVFNPTTKVTQITGASGTFTVPVGVTYTIFGVQGPSTSDGLGQATVTPAAPVSDTTAPVTTSDAKATYVSSAVIKLSATDAVGVTATYFKLDGGVQTAGTTINVLTPGAHTLVFWSVDAAGNVEVQKTASFSITIPDTTAPVTTSDAKATYVSSAVIKLSATDAVGVTATYFKLDGGVQTAGTTINVATAGSHTLVFWSVDAAGNVESQKSVTFVITVPAPVDTIAPVTTSDAKATYVSSAVIKLSATDAVGVTATYFKLDGGVQTAGTTINVATAGSHTLVFWSVDAAGNVESQKSVTFVITVPAPVDTIAPVTTSDAKATYVSSSVIKLSATDAVGVAATYYRLDGGAQTSGTTINVATAGSHTLVFWSVDAAGNVEAQKSVTFVITVPAPVDTIAPVTTSDAKATYVSSAAIKLSATDNVGVAHTYYRLDGGAQVEGMSMTITAIGSHACTFWSVDAAGNTEAVNTVTFAVTAPVPVPDTTAPVTTSDAKASYVSSAVIKLSATDAVGVAHTYYIVNGAAQVEGTTISLNAVGSYTIEFWSVDAAGNVEAHKTATLAITAPAPAPTSAITIKASASTVRIGSSVRLSGVLTPAKDDANVSVYVKKPGSSTWVLVNRDETSDNGAWSLRYTPRSRGTYQFQVRYGTLVSSTIKISVTRSSNDD